MLLFFLLPTIGFSQDRPFALSLERISSCYDTASPLYNRLPIDVPLVKSWHEELYKIRDCSEALKKRRLVSTVNYEEVRKNIRFMRSISKSSSCESMYNDLFNLLDPWVKYAKSVLAKCPQINHTEIESTNYSHVVYVPVARVRENEITNTKGNIIDRLPAGTFLKLVDTFSTYQDVEWGRFVYQKNGKKMLGWIRIDLTKRLQRYNEK